MDYGQELDVIGDIMGRPPVEVNNVSPLEANTPSAPTKKESVFIDAPMPDIKNVPDVPLNFAESICNFVAPTLSDIEEPKPEPVIEKTEDEEDDPILEIKVSMKRKSGRTQDMWLSDVEIARYRQKMRNKEIASKAKPKKKVTPKNDPSYAHRDNNKTKQEPDTDPDIKTYVRQNPKTGQDVGKKKVKEMATNVGSIGVNMAPPLLNKKKRGLKSALDLASKLQKEKK